MTGPVTSLGGRVALWRGAAQLPSALTMVNLFLGCAAIIRALHGDFAVAAELIVGAALFDVLDGGVARLTGTCSALGAQLDSLADLVSFGVAPAVLAFEWGLADHGLPFAVAFVYVLAAALRLARFNVAHAEADPGVFTGLPSPAAAGLIVSVVAFHPDAPVGADAAVLVTVVLVVASVLMVSPIPYVSLKAAARPPKPRTVVLVALPMAVLAVLEPTATLLVATWSYALAGPARALAAAVSSPPEEPPGPDHPRSGYSPVSSTTQGCTQNDGVTS